MRKVGQMKPKMPLSRGRRGRRGKLLITPTQEKDTLALKILGEDGWDRVATGTRRFENQVRDVETYQDIGVLRKEIHEWAQDQ